MIVDLVRNDLGGCASGGRSRCPPCARSSTTEPLVHLVSTVTGRLRPRVTWGDVIAATFPPGSVTGAPKLAMASTTSPGSSRPPWPSACGAVGWVDADRCQGELNVAIRTFWVEDGRLHRYRWRHHLGLDSRGRVGRDRAQGPAPAGRRGRRARRRALAADRPEPCEPITRFGAPRTDASPAAGPRQDGRVDAGPPGRRMARWTAPWCGWMGGWSRPATPSCRCSTTG